MISSLMDGDGMANRSEIMFQNGAAMVLAISAYKNAPEKSIPPVGFMEIKWNDTNFYIREPAVSKTWKALEVDTGNIWGIYARNSIGNYNRIYETRGEIYCYMGANTAGNNTMYFISADTDAFLNLRDWQEIQTQNRLSWDATNHVMAGSLTMGSGSILEQYRPSVKVTDGAQTFARWKGLKE